MKSQRDSSGKRKRKDSELPEKKAASAQPKPKRRRRKRKDDGDRAYHPRGKKRGGKGKQDAFLLRSIKFQREGERLVTMFCFDENVITGINQEIALQHIHQASTAIREGKPLLIRVLKRSATGTPQVVMTPGKTKYYLTQNQKSMMFFSSIPPAPEREELTELKSDNPLLKSESYRYVQKNREDKHHKVFLTHAHLQAVAKQAAKRPITQNAAMATEKKHAKKASATAYAQATEIFDPEEMFEYLHEHAASHIGFLSKSMLKKLGSQIEFDAQDPINLVIGTYHANTHMIPVECTAPALAEALDGVEIDVNPRMVKIEGRKKESTQIAEEIDYVIRRGEFKWVSHFHTLTNRPPHLQQKDYVNEFSKGLIKAIKGNDPAIDGKHTSEAIEKQYNFETPKSKKTIVYQKNPHVRRNLNPEFEETTRSTQPTNPKIHKK